MRITKAVIPAAGWGTRLLPASKALPKEMLPIVDKPAIQYVVEEAVAAGVTDILIITSRGKLAIEDHFDLAPEMAHDLAARGKQDLLPEIEASAKLANVHFIRQPEMRGLGHAILYARSFAGTDPVAVLLPDDIIDAPTPALVRMAEIFAEVRTSLVAVQAVPAQDVSKYGIIRPQRVVRPGLSTVAGLVEKPTPDAAPSNLGVIGRYILTPGVFEFLRRGVVGAGGEIQLTDALAYLAETEGVHAWELDGTRLDVGNKLGLLLANMHFALKRPDLRPALLDYLRRAVQ